MFTSPVPGKGEPIAVEVNEERSFNWSTAAKAAGFVLGFLVILTAILAYLQFFPLGAYMIGGTGLLAVIAILIASITHSGAVRYKIMQMLEQSREINIEMQENFAKKQVAPHPN